MDSDANVLQSSANLAGGREANMLAGQGNEDDAGHKNAVAVGAAELIDPLVDNERRPLLGRSISRTEDGRLISSEGSNGSENHERDHSPPTWNGMADFEDMSWYKRPSVVWLLGPFLLFAMTFGGTIVPGIEVITQLLCHEKMIEQGLISINSTSSTISPSPLLDESQDRELCSTDPQVQASVAIFTLWAQVIGGILAAITSPKLGSLSDRHGRTKLIALAASGTIAKDAMFILMFHFPYTMNVRWLFLAYALDGLCGSFTTGMAITHAYASDCTPPSKRSVAFGWFHGCLFTGVALGPLLAAYVIKSTGQVVWIFYLAAGINIFFVLFVLLVAPESLTKARQKAAKEKKRQELERYADSLHYRHGATIWARTIVFLKDYNIFAPLSILFPTGPGTSTALRWNMVVLAAVDTVMFAVAMGAMTVTIIYTGAVFGWHDFERNVFMSVVNIARVTCLVVVLPIVTRIFRGRLDSSKLGLRENGCDDLDIWLIRIAVTFDMLGFAGYAVAPNGSAMIVSGVLASIGGMGSPTLQSSLTKHVSPDQVGQILGATGLLHALARVVAPMACNFIYAKTVVRGMPSVVFMVLAGCFAVALFLSFFIKTGLFVDEKVAQGGQEPLSREEEVMIRERGEEDEVI